jgi:hypothetical protein
MKKTLFIALILLFIISCIRERYKYFIGSFPETPVNLTDFNTEFDDYNSTLSTLGETFPFCFSSNRKSGGSNYDIVYKLITISFSKKNGKLEIFENKPSFLDVSIENANILSALNKINTQNDEFGPYLISKGMNYNGNNLDKRYEMYIFLYSNNSNGNQDIKFTQNLQNEFYEEPKDVKFLNSEFDDAYPTFNKDFSEIYFTSNRNKNFNIYKAIIDKNQDLIDLLKNTDELPIRKDTILSSEFDDKCPFISNDLMVFASNREGGFGGFDLYYSRFENGKWNEPKNFGNKVNTEYDEYRPILRPQQDFKNDLMIFSSNRTGGKGGFDLYYVGIDKLLK